MEEPYITLILLLLLMAFQRFGYVWKRRNCEAFAHYHLRRLPFIWIYFTTNEPDRSTCPTCHRPKAKGRELEFISVIARDGSGTKLISANMEHLDDTTFHLNSLSLTNKTYIASETNSYVVRLKPTP